MRRVPLAFALVLSFPACSGGGASDTGMGTDSATDSGTGTDTDGDLIPLDIPEGCNPLAADADCLLPWPSDVFLVPDPDMPSGVRVEHPAAGLPVSDKGEPIDFLSYLPADGASHQTQILALFPGGIDDAPLVGFGEPLAESVVPTSNTLVLNAATGEPVLHMAEVDPRALSEDRRALVIRPLERLDNETTYIVAVQGLTDAAGGDVPTPEGFRRVRDGQTAADPELMQLVSTYEDIVFPTLETFGVARDDLQLAWTFTTQSQASVTDDLLSMREEAVALATPALAITTSEDQPVEFPGTFRRIEGTIEVPLYLDSDAPGGRLLRGGDGLPVAQSTAVVPFLAMIPQSVADAGVPARVVQFGHGFFGSREEIARDPMMQFSQQTATITIAVDWWGLSEPDQIFVVADLFERPDELMALTDRLHQAMVNQLALSKAIRGALASDPAFQDAGTNLLDPNALYFYGISLGHILGGTQVALNPEIDAAAFSVGGAGFSLIMMRSVPFAQFLGLIESLVPDALDQQKYAYLTQMSFDRVDPGTYAPHVLTDTYPGSPASRRVLIHDGLGDTSVPNLSTHLHARALGLSVLEPAVRAIEGLQGMSGPLPSAIVEFDFGLPEPLPEAEATPADVPSAVHGDVRMQAAAIDQIDMFFSADGMVNQTCDGACDPD